MSPAAAPEPVVEVPPPADADRPERFAEAIAAIDAANREDPNLVRHGGSSHPKELLHAQLMSAWLLELDPGAGEAAHLAARAHHFRRWTRPRSEHPAGRAGYLRWRAAARRAHADEVGELLARVGYDDATSRRVGQIVRKEGLGVDPAVQSHEDALCLVFLTTQLLDVADQLGDEHTVAVLRRTLPKMSAPAVARAAALDLGARGATLLARATAPEG